MLKHLNRAPAKQKGNTPENSETAIDQPPDERDATNLAGDERQRDDPGTRDETECDHPFVAYRIDKGTNERGRDREVREAEPIGAVSEKRIAGAGRVQSNCHLIDPSGQAGRRNNCLERPGVNKRIKPVDFGPQRKCRDAAEHEPRHEDGKPEADELKRIEVSHFLSQVIEALAANSV